jgi:hypothetical protein
VAHCGGSLGTVQCTQSGCSGSFAVGCDDPASPLIDVGVDCSASGAGRCEPSDAGPVCAPVDPAKSCVAERAAGCEGSAVSACLSGREIRVDCRPDAFRHRESVRQRTRCGRVRRQRPMCGDAARGVWSGCDVRGGLRERRSRELRDRSERPCRVCEALARSSWRETTIRSLDSSARDSVDRHSIR